MSQDNIEIVIELEDTLVTVDDTPSIDVKTESSTDLDVQIDFDDVLVKVDEIPSSDIQTKVDNEVQVILAGNTGPRGLQGDVGPTGPQGIKGDKGDPGSDNSFRYVHDQGIPSSTWIVAHNLDGFPNVTVVDSAGTSVEGEVDYIDQNNIVLHFSAIFTGKAYLS